MSRTADTCMEGKKVIRFGDSIPKHLERYASSYSTYFPASTVVNAGIPGDTVEAILYRALNMPFPSSVTDIFLLCGTNNLSSTAAATISATIMEILLFYTRNAQLLLFTSFRFCLDSIIISPKYMLLTYLLIFRSKKPLQTVFSPMICRCHCTTGMCTGMTIYI